jgi:hypothetical protein
MLVIWLLIWKSIINAIQSWSWSYGSWIYNYQCNDCLSPLRLWVRISIRVRCTTLCDKVCQCLAAGRWFSPGIPVSSTNKTDRHDMTEILLKVALKTISLNQAIKYCGVKQHVPFTSTGSTEEKHTRVRETRRCNQEYILTNPYRR